MTHRCKCKKNEINQFPVTEIVDTVFKTSDVPPPPSATAYDIFSGECCAQ